MKPNDLTIVQARPEARTVASDSIMYLETALLVSPLAAELLCDHRRDRVPVRSAQ
jgi:hypothetical protein